MESLGLIQIYIDVQSYQFTLFLSISSHYSLIYSNKQTFKSPLHFYLRIHCNTSLPRPSDNESKFQQRSPWFLQINTNEYTVV